MLEWRDQGILVAVRGHGENSVIIEVLTRHHGRHAGVVKGGQSAKVKPHLQLGNFVEVTWKARLEEHLGQFKVEPLAANAPYFMRDSILTSGLATFCAMVHYALPERLDLEGFYENCLMLFEPSDSLTWAKRYAHWELSLLTFLGFALDLETCAVTGQCDDLIYISPRTGRAVSRQAAQEWAPRLFEYPEIFRKTYDTPCWADIAQGLLLLEHFLARELHDTLPKGRLPAARARFCAILEKEQNR